MPSRLNGHTFVYLGQVESRSVFAATEEVTQRQWTQVMGTSPNLERIGTSDPCRGTPRYPAVGDNLPVTCISFAEAEAYADALNALLPEDLAPHAKVGLPTARMRTHVQLPGDPTALCDVANVADYALWGKLEDVDRFRVARCDDGDVRVRATSAHVPVPPGLLGWFGNVEEWGYDDEGHGVAFGGSYLTMVNDLYASPGVYQRTPESPYTSRTGLRPFLILDRSREARP